MTRSRTFWLLGIIAGFAALLIGGLSLVVGTESGTRWLLRQAEDYLPQELEIGELRGSLLRGVRVDSIEWRDASLRVSIERLALKIELAPVFAQRVAINELDVERVDVELLETGESDTEGSLPTIELPVGISVAGSSIRNVSILSAQSARSIDSISLVGQMIGSDLDVTRLGVRSEWLDLDLAGHAKLAGSHPSNVSITWQWRQSEELRIAGELLLNGSASRYEVRHSLAAPILVTTNGFVTYESGVLFAELTSQWQELEWAFGDRKLRSSVGTLLLRGDTSNFAVELNALAQLDDQPETEIELEGDAELEGVRISHLNLANELGRLSVTGDATWLPLPTMDVAFDLSELDPALALDGVVGVVELHGQAAGRLVEDKPEFDLRVERIGGRINDNPLQGSATASYANDTLTLAEGLIQIGSNRASASGALGKNLILDAELDLPAVDELAPDASGWLKGYAKFNGPSNRPNARIKMTGSALRWANYAAGTLSVDALISSAETNHATLNLQQVNIRSTVLDSVQISASGQIDEHSIRALLNGYGNQLELDAAGGYSDDRWVGNIESLVVKSNALGTWSNRQPAELVASTEKITLSEVCLVGSSDSANACLTIDYQKDGRAAFDASIAQLPLSALPIEIPQDINVTGFIDAHLHGQLDDQRLSGDARLELLDASVSATYEGDAVSVAFSNAVGQATIADNRVESTLRVDIADGAGSGNVSLNIEDIANNRSAIQGNGTVSVSDASLFAVFVPGITNPRGKIDGSFAATGNLSEPEFAGQIALSEGYFAVRQAGIEISDIDVRLQQLDAGRLQLIGSARSGEGQVSIQGNARISADTGVRTEVVISGENFELARLPDWQIAASPSISVLFDERAALVTGELGIPSADITIRAVPETAESPSPDATVHRSESTPSPTGRRIDVKVKTVLGNEVRLTGFGLTTGIEGTVQLEGGSHTPYLGFGRLSLREGRYKAYGQELEIERGELIFNGPLENPNLDVRAIRRANDVVAGIQLSGTPTQLSSDVFSEPPLSDAEILAYLLTGRPLSSATTSGEGDTLNKAAFALGLSQAGSITSQIRGELGLETLTVEGGAESGRIVAGKRIGNRLLVEYGYGLIDKLGTLLLRYQLNDRIVLESRTGTVSNLDILYSVKKD